MGYEQVDALLRQCNDYANERPYGAGSRVERVMEQWMQSRLPSWHTQWCHLMAQAFTPKAIAGLRSRIERIGNQMLDGLPCDEAFDFMERFASPFPVRVIASTMGLPMANSRRLQRWSNAIARVLEPNADTHLRHEADRALDDWSASFEQRSTVIAHDRATT